MDAYVDPLATERVTAGRRPQHAAAKEYVLVERDALDCRIELFARDHLRFAFVGPVLLPIFPARLWPQRQEELVVGINLYPDACREFSITPVPLFTTANGELLVPSEVNLFVAANFPPAHLPPQGFLGASQAGAFIQSSHAIPLDPETRPDRIDIDWLSRFHPELGGRDWSWLELTLTCRLSLEHGAPDALTVVLDDLADLDGKSMLQGTLELERVRPTRYRPLLLGDI